MSYHVFQINAFNQAEFLEAYPDYRKAKDAIKKLRQEASTSAGYTYRMMFATSPEHAEKLLNEKREPRPMGEHD